jgi:uncharacterized iron-regulated membrane protein
LVVRRPLYRLHVWLGWTVAVPLLLWTFTGLWMVARPIEEVRGEHLRAPPRPIVAGGPIAWPQGSGGTLRSLALESRPGGAVWVAHFMSGEMRRADPATGRLLPPVTKAEAVALARSAIANRDYVVRVTRSSASKPPLELRRSRPAWAVHFNMGARVYVDADTGSILALRTTQWRLFDLMWGLHIMDPQTREDTSHPLLIGAAALSLVGVITGSVLLFARRRKRGRTGT